MINNITITTVVFEVTVDMIRTLAKELANWENGCGHQKKKKK